MPVCGRLWTDGEFGDALLEMLRDRLVGGVNDKKVQRCVASPLTLSKAGALEAVPFNAKRYRDPLDMV